MFDINGKYGSAKVYAETIDDACISQIYGFLNNPITENVKVAKAVQLVLHKKLRIK